MNGTINILAEDIEQFDSTEFNLDCFDIDGNFIDETDTGGLFIHLELFCQIK